MPIEIPDITLDHLHSAPLKVAVAQVRYSPVHAVEKRDLVAEFESRLNSRYVAQNARTPQALTIQVGPGTAPGGLGPLAGVDTVWPFRDSERGYSVSLGNSSLAVEADATYHDFPQFLQELRTAASACAEVFQPKRELRLGLRYINEIADVRLGQDVRAVISPDLVPPVGTALQGDLLRSFAEIRVAESLGTFVIHHGLVEENRYLLDFDYFSEREHDFSPDRVIETIEGFHELIERFFVWSLNPDYLLELKGSDDDAA